MSYSEDAAFALVESAHKRGRLGHAFLITGPPGCGKERLAARIIDLVAVEGGGKSGGMNLFGEPEERVIKPLDEMEGSWVRVIRPRMKSRKIGVDVIRNLERSLHVAAPGGVSKVGVIVEADRMGTESSNAFLKTLEEPSVRTVILLLTASPERLLPTVISRCIKLPLNGKVDLLADGGADLVTALERVASKGFGSPRGALTVKSVFSQVLESRSDIIEKAKDAAIKEEVDAYKNAVEGSWLEDREEFHEAAARAEYLGVRSRLFDVLLAWMADIVRSKTGSGGLDFPQSAAVTAEVAAKESLRGLLTRMEHLDNLRRLLETNVQEQLALEVGFLKAFG